MKRTIFIYAILLITVITIFSACKKSDTNSNILGDWELTTAQGVVVDSVAVPIKVTTTDSSYTHGKSIIAQFGNNNTYTFTDHSVSPAFIRERGTYSLSNGKIVLTSSRGGPTTGVTETDRGNYTISGNTLTITIFVSESEYSTIQTEVFNRQ